MNKHNRISALEVKLKTMRDQWREASPAMRHIIEQDAKTIKHEITLLERVIRKQNQKTPAKLL